MFLSKMEKQRIEDSMSRSRFLIKGLEVSRVSGQRDMKMNTDLIFGSALSDELVANLDAGLQQVLVQIGSGNSEQMSDPFTLFGSVSLGLLLSWPLLELHLTKVHDGCYDSEDVILFFLRESQHVESSLLDGK